MSDLVSPYADIGDGPLPAPVIMSHSENVSQRHQQNLHLGQCGRNTDQGLTPAFLCVDHGSFGRVTTCVVFFLYVV